ncbi:Phosphoric monoester hydrolase [Sarracenia purpurea var. burkii]
MGWVLVMGFGAGTVVEDLGSREEELGSRGEESESMGEGLDSRGKGLGCKGFDESPSESNNASVRIGIHGEFQPNNLHQRPERRPTARHNTSSIIVVSLQIFLRLSRDSLVAGGEVVPTSPDFHHEQQNREPDDGLNHRRLNDEVDAELAVHSFQQRNSDDKRVGQRGQREAGYGPAVAALAAALGPEGEHRDDDDFGDGVGAEEEEVHPERVDVGGELEGEEREGEEADQAVYGVALLRLEDPPPSHRSVP